MKQHEAKDFLPIIKAWSEGKTVQYRLDLDGKPVWQDMAPAISFDDSVEFYRIKPEPVTVKGYALFFKDGAKYVIPADGAYDHGAYDQHINNESLTVVPFEIVKPE